MIKIGSKVTWSYKAGGVEYSQSGKVLAFVEADVDMNDAMGDLGIEASGRQKKYAATSSNARYLVQVKNDGVIQFYAPTQSTLDAQNPKAVKAFEKEFVVAINTAKAPLAPTPMVAVATKAKEASVTTKAPRMNTVYSQGNATQYKICGTTAKGGFVGYRLRSGNHTLKFLVSEAGHDWTYKSGVRAAYSGFVYAAVKGTPVGDNLSIPECIAFAKSVATQLTKDGFEVSVETLCKELEAASKQSQTRRVITAKLGTS